MARLHGWRGKLACFLFGALLAAAFAPLRWWWVAPISLPFLFLMLDRARHWRSAALYGWAFGYGHMMAGTYWIANALLVDAAQFAWLLPVSVLGLSLVLGIWFGLFGALYRRWRTENTLHNLLRFAILWGVVEYLRTLGPFGFPWNLLGSAVLASAPLSQLLALVGPYGAGFAVMGFSLLPVVFLKAEFSKSTRRIAVAVAMATLIAWAAYGMHRLVEPPRPSETRIRIVQGNIAQSLKWTEEGRYASARIYAQLTQQGTDRPPITVWPETAMPFTLRESSPWTAEIGALLPPGGVLITGAVRSEGEGAGYRLFNSMTAIDAEGRRRDDYDKHQLVPFGEFVPLRSVLPLDKITPGNIDFSRGPAGRTVAFDAVPRYRPLVCYEIIFPWLSAGGERPAWILNATNDAWYGLSPGPFQHFDAARMRAIEQGLPVVRAANTGISAIIDPAGRVIERLELNRRGVIDAALPQPQAATIYSGFGEYITLTIFLVGAIVTISSHFRPKK